jgi:hypothetical protein
LPVTQAPLTKSTTSYTMNGENILQKSGLFIPFTLSPNFYAFLGGVFISAAVNLYTGVFAGEAVPTRWKIILISALLAFISGTLWSMIAWNLETINRLAITQSPEFVDEQKIWRKLIMVKLPKLTTYLLGALSCALASSVILLF